MATVVITLTDTPEGKVTVSTQVDPPRPAGSHPTPARTKAEIVGAAITAVATGKSNPVQK